MPSSILKGKIKNLVQKLLYLSQNLPEKQGIFLPSALCDLFFKSLTKI